MTPMHNRWQSVPASTWHKLSNQVPARVHNVEKPNWNTLMKHTVLAK